MIARLRLELKNQRIVYFAPVAVVLILVPLVVWSYYNSIGGDPETQIFLGRLHLIRIGQMFVPLMAGWWPIFVMKEYLNAPGNEVLFAYRFGWDTLMMRCLALWLWYGLHWTLVCAGLSLILGGIFPVWSMVMLQSFMLIAVAYCLAMLSKNTFLPLMLVVLYCLACLLFKIPMSIFNLDARFEDPQELFAEMLPALRSVPVGLIFLAIGGFLEKRLWKKGR